MLNVSDLSNYKSDYKKVLNKVFNKNKKTKVKFIRLATHFSEIDEVTKVCKFLKTKNYKIIINLMQITEQKEKDIINAAKKIALVNPSVLYFADSLGAMDTPDVSKYVKLLRKYWKGELGIHTHNNLGKALSNSLAAIKMELLGLTLL